MPPTKCAPALPPARNGADDRVQPYEHAASVYERAMSDCEADFAAVLAAHGTARLPSAAWLADKAAPENLRGAWVGRQGWVVWGVRTPWPFGILTGRTWWALDRASQAR